MLTGEVDVIADIDATTADRLKGRNGVIVVDVASTLHYTFPMRTDMAPFDNNHVRMALKLSIDRQDVLDKILGGYGSL